MFGIEIDAFSIHLQGHSSTSKEFCFTVHGKKTFACNLIILKYFKGIEIDINFSGVLQDSYYKLGCAQNLSFIYRGTLKKFVYIRV